MASNLLRAPAPAGLRGWWSSAVPRHLTDGILERRCCSSMLAAHFVEPALHLLRQTVDGFERQPDVTSRLLELNRHALFEFVQASVQRARTSIMLIEPAVDAIKPFF
jgi:hypothetical protein